MATRKRSTIKSRNERISARKPKTLAGLIKESQRITKSLKESLAIGGALAGPGKFKQAGKVIKKVLKSPVKKGPDVRNPRTLAKGRDAERQRKFQEEQAKLRRPDPGRQGIEAAKRDDLARAAASPGGKLRAKVAARKSGAFSPRQVKAEARRQTALEAPLPKRRLRAPSFKAKRSTTGKSTRVSKREKVPKDSRGREVEGNFQEIEGRRVFVPDK